MASPSTLTWISATTNTIVNDYTLNNADAIASLTLNTSTYKTTFTTPSLVQNPIYIGGIGNSSPQGNGVTTQYYQMPDFYNRGLSYTSSENIAAGSFVITGTTFEGTSVEFGSPALTASETTYDEDNYVYIITNISAAAELTGTISIGLGNYGRTGLFIADQWNKVNNYTIAIENTTGSISVTPRYCVVPAISFPNGQPVTDSDFYTFYDFPYANTAAITLSPSDATFPITQSVAVSTINIPLTGIVVDVSDTTGEFIQTILQQGARF